MKMRARRIAALEGKVTAKPPAEVYDWSRIVPAEREWLNLLCTNLPEADGACDLSDVALDELKRLERILTQCLLPVAE